MNWIHTGIWLYTLIIWALTVVFIIHCLRSRNLYRPYQLPLNLVKLFWVLGLITFSPFILLAYFIFAILLSPQPGSSKTYDTFASVMIVLLFILSIPWLQFPRTLTPHEEYTRIGSEWVTEDPSPAIDGRFHLGTIESNNSFSTSTSSSSSSDCLFACRKIAIIMDDHHPLNREVLEPIVESLKSLPFVEEIKTLSWTNITQLNGRLPDLFIRITAPKIDESYFPPRLRLNAQYEIQASDRLLRSNNYYGGNTVLPLFQMRMNIEFDHQSTTTFVGTPNSKYALVAKDIGKELAKAIGKTLREQAGKYPLLPQEADAFLPEPTQEHTLPFPSLRETESLFTGYRPFVSRIAHWKIEDPSAQTKAIDGLMRDVQSAGWYAGEGTDTQKKPRFWRFYKDGSCLEILEEPSPSLEFNIETQPETTKPLYIIYSEEMSKEEVIDVLKQREIQQWPLSLLLSLKETIRNDSELKDSFFQRLKGEKSISASQYLLLADMWQSMNDLEQEWQNLNKALIFSYAKPDSTNDENSIQERMKKFQQKHPEFQSESMPESIYDSIGFISIPADDTWETTQDVHLDQPVLLWRQSDDGELNILSIWMTYEQGNNISPSYTLHFRNKSKTGSSESATGGTDTWNSSNSFDEDTFNVESKLIGDKRFQIIVRKQKTAS